MSLPAKGICLMQLPITYPSQTGITCVTPSPESNTVPVKLSFALNLSLNNFIKNTFCLNLEIRSTALKLLALRCIKLLS